MAIVADDKFTFLHMPKTGGVTAYNLLHMISGDTNKPYAYHVPLDEVKGAEGLPIVIGSRDVDAWHVSYYNYVFRQLIMHNYHIHELFIETPTFDQFMDFSNNKVCDYGQGENNPNNPYDGFKFVTTIFDDWWDYDGNLYNYIRDHLLCDKKPDYEIRQGRLSKDWLAVYEDLSLLTPEIESKILEIGKYNRGAF